MYVTLLGRETSGYPGIYIRNKHDIYGFMGNDLLANIRKDLFIIIK
jgi:hypothetical protein